MSRLNFKIKTVFKAMLIVFTLMPVQSFFSAAHAGEFPGEMAGLKLLHEARGEEAKKLIYNLHGKILDLHQGFVLRYGDPTDTSAAATVWISRSKEDNRAAALFERMVERIRAGAGPYGHFKELTVKESKVVSLFGNDKRHFIYRRGKDLLWIEVDYKLAEAFLEEALEKMK